MKFLLDASSLLQVIKNFREERALRLLSENCILDLTKYEVGNALWKEQMLHQAIEEEELQEFFGLLRGLVLRTNVLTVDARKLSDVARIAAKERITFYDASYVAVAKAHNVTLITEDRELTDAASKYVKAGSMERLRSI